MKKTIHPHELDDAQTIKSATRQGHPIHCYDDGYGPLFIHRDSMGITGIVRAQTWADAYEICEDEFFPAADKEAGEEYERIQTMDDGEEKNHAEHCYNEAYGHRSNTRSDGSSVYARDMNGDQLDTLSRTLATELEILLEIEIEIEID